MNSEQAIEVLKDLPPLKFSQRLAVTKAIAALSKEPAKPEHNCTCPNFNCKACTYQPLPAKLPEEEWIRVVAFQGTYTPRDIRPMILAEDVRGHLARLTAAHEAALAKKDAFIAEMVRMAAEKNRPAYDEQQHRIMELEAALIEAEANGRREALQSVPVDDLARAVEHCYSMMDFDTPEPIETLIESARAAQKENTK